MTLLSTSHSASQVVSRRLNCKWRDNKYSGYRMKTFPVVLVFTVVLAAVSGSEAGSVLTSITHVANWSSRLIRVTIEGGPGDNPFRDRLIEPYTWKWTEYWGGPRYVDIEIWMEGSPSHGWVKVWDDRSIVVFDNGANIDIYLAKYGKLTVIDDLQPEKLTTIYPR